MSLPTGTRLGPYEIVAPLGAGGMGEVYKATDTRLDRTVAVKVARAQFTERFEREARTIAALNHPNICQLYDVGPNYLVMEYIVGEPLTGPLPVAQALKYASQICDALDAAHNQGIVHRDLKPANIMVTKTGIKLLDFGLAKIMREPSPVDHAATESLITAEQSIIGTLQYMAPEQLEGKEASVRSDIFSFGAMLYELVSGQRAFQGASRASVIAAIMEREPTSIGTLPPALERVIRRCVAKNPDERWQSVRDLKFELEQIGQDSAVQPPPKPRKNLTLKLYAAAMVLMIFGVGAFALWSRHTNTDARSIAVLPFKDLSPDKDQSYFADGLAEEITGSLFRVPGWRVAAQTSASRFKETTLDTRSIGQKLNVATVLEGSVRKQGNRVRISVQLIKTADGFQLWSTTFERQLTDIFAIQDEIASAVTAALGVVKQEPHPNSTTNAEAYNAYLQGRYYMQRGNKENFEKASVLFDRATQISPNYAKAWIGVAQVRMSQANWGFADFASSYAKAREAAEHALALDDRLAEAHGALGNVKMFQSYDWEGARASFRRGLELEASNSDVLFSAAVLARELGRFDEAIAYHRRQVEVDPLNPTAFHDYAMTLHYAGRQPEAKEAILKSLDLAPDMDNSRGMLSRILLAQSQPAQAVIEAEREKHPIFRLCGLGLAYHAAGRTREADATLAELIAKYQKDAPYQIADVYAFRGEVDKAFEWLDRAFKEHDTGLTEVKTDPLFEKLRHDPRFLTVLDRMKFH